MADPIIHEPMLLAALSPPVTVAGIEALQSAALMATVNGFDRRLTRDSYINLTASAFSLHTHLGRLHMINRIHELFKQEKLTEERLSEAETQLLAFCEAERVTLKNLTSLVTMCPTSNDPIS